MFHSYNAALLALGLLLELWQTQAQTTVGSAISTDIMDSSVSSSRSSSTTEMTSTTAISALSTATSSGTLRTPQLDVVENMCWRMFHQSTIKNGSLYIDGGIESFINALNDSLNYDSSSPVTLGYNYHLIEIDLSQPWDWQKNISELTLDKVANDKTGTPVPQVVDGTLFSGIAEDSRIWLYGGTTSWWNTSFGNFTYPDSQMYSLWSYDTNSRDWDQFDVTSGSQWRPSNGLAAEAPELGLGFYFNGEIDSGSSQLTEVLGDEHKIFLQGMVVVNTTSQSASNISTAAATGDNPRTRGGVTYIPAIGDSGVLALMGGTFKNVLSTDSDETSTFAPLYNITLFDIGAYLRNAGEQLWYTQTATGDVPEPRGYFCTVLASASDNSSHNIYLYSGIGENSAVYDDVYILSIPSFIWTKINNGTSPRFGHTCHRVGNQMITVGGRAMAQLGQDFPCDWERRGVGVLDMSNVEWGSVFKPESQAGTYFAPKAVQDAIME